MNIELAEVLTLKLMDEWGLLEGGFQVKYYLNSESSQGVYRTDPRRWTFRWLPSNASRLSGRCEYQPHLIRLSRKFVAANIEEDVRDTILHEIAHVISPGAGHGPGFLAACKEVGCKPRKFAPEHVRRGVRWRAVCPHCELEHFKATVRRKKGQFCKCLSVAWQHKHNPAGLIWELNPAYQQVEEELMAHAKKVAKKVAKKRTKKVAAKKATTKKAAAPKKATKTKVKGGTVGTMARELILKGKLSNSEIADVVREKLGSNTSTASVAWYRSQMRKDGLIK